MVEYTGTLSVCPGIFGLRYYYYYLICIYVNNDCIQNAVCDFLGPSVIRICVKRLKNLSLQVNGLTRKTHRKQFDCYGDVTTEHKKLAG